MVSINHAVSVAAFLLGVTVPASAIEPGCDATRLMLRNATIIDGSGRWDDQDIFIENGRISAIASDIELETTRAFREMDAAGGVVRPRQDDEGAIFIRTSVRADPAQSEVILMPGTPADLTITPAAGSTSGDAVIELEGGRVLGHAADCSAR